MRELLLSHPKCRNISSSTDLKQNFRSYKKVGTQTEMFLNKVDLESKFDNSVKNVNMQNTTCKAPILTSEIKQEEKSMVTKEATMEDIDLDKLLEISEAHTGSLFSLSLLSIFVLKCCHVDTNHSFIQFSH